MFHLRRPPQRVAVAEEEQGRGLADGPRTKPRAGPILCPHIEGGTQNCRIGVDRIPIQTRRLLAEGAVPNEGPV